MVTAQMNITTKANIMLRMHSIRDLELGEDDMTNVNEVVACVKA